ncbi:MULTISPECIES: YqaA family protein [Helicobacter]|uniref:DedA family protein n=1 Tax=Helicobacter ibis TaxID=2962633 RepID=A0ABT4VBN2_9HELI|nr:MULTISPECIES: YqaA family protein [Helicobacter]MDA3966886.1 DedA family protein [Helicobacter sp. WB40]MDA3968113.1 DedA family protein [Helicobacter ibis]
MIENLGILGLFLISFIASSLYPLGSEVFVAMFIKLGYDKYLVLLVATLGNTLGTLSTYAIGYFGTNLILHSRFKENIKKAIKYVNITKKFGSLCAFFTFLPIIGDIFALALGITRCNLAKMIIFVTLGKTLRYYLIIHFISA